MDMEGKGPHFTLQGILESQALCSPRRQEIKIKKKITNGLE